MARPVRRNRNRLLLLVLVMVIGSAILFVLSSRNAGHQPPAENTAQHFEPTVEEPASPPPVVATAPPPYKPEEAEPVVAASHPTIERFLELSRYPASTRRIDENSLDILHPNMRHERRGPVPDDDGDEPGWEVLYTADRYALRGDETTELSFELWRDGEPVAPTKLELVAEPVGVPPSGARRLGVSRDGARRTALFEPQRHWPNHLGTLRVTARFEAPGLGDKRALLTFFFTPEQRLPAEFTGEFDDWLLNGDLAIGVGVDVETPGTYRIEGNLYDVHGTPVAWARLQDDLATGKQEVNLVFDGLVFHDAGVRPPYTLRELRGYRLRPGDAPHREDMKAYSARYTIQDRYVLSDFRGEPKVSEHTLDMVARYEDALERGVRLTRPRE